MSASGDERFDYLVTACYKGKRTFPICTVTDCENGTEAIDTVLGMGFCFSRGCWVLQAVQVALIQRDISKPAAA
jgi:hypothetical protein